MTVQFIGAIGFREGSESVAPRGPVIDKLYISTLARAHELAGFDRVLVPQFSVTPDSFQVAAYLATQTERLGLLLAHRPGFVAPTLAARQLATLDHISDGRVAVHIITGFADREQQQDGDFLGKAERYARSDDYLDLLGKSWTSPAPFDHDGPYYRTRESFSAIKPLQSRIPIFFGGASDEAQAVAGKHADVYVVWGEPLEQTAETIAKIQSVAATHGRAHKLGIGLSVRIILGRTEEEAWARAARILEAAKTLRSANPPPQAGQTPQNAGSVRLLEIAAGGAVRDKRLWTELTTLTGAAGSTTALVGTAAQVAEALLDYHDLGIENFLIRGFDYIEDTVEIGRELIPLVRAAVADRAAAHRAAE